MQFLYPNFLWGLLAVGVPVLIHLLQLRRPQRVIFTNTGFIKAVELTIARRRRLQNLLVLLIRVVAVIALIIAFCQPFLPAKILNTSASNHTIAVLIDNSPSMQVPALQHGSLLQQAVEKAQELGKTYGNAAQFQLLSQGGTSNEAAYKTKLSAMQATLGKVAWDKPTLYQGLARSDNQPLYIFSDFQKSAAGNNLLKKIPISGEVVLVPQISRSAGNIYVDSVWLDDAFVRVNVNLGLHIRLRNGGTESVADCPVKVLLGQRQIAAFRTSVGVGQTTTTLVQVQLPTAKLALGRVVTEDAPVTFDNTYYFTLQPAATIKILEVGPVPFAQQAYTNEALFDYSFEKPQELNYNKLQQADLVLVSEVTRVDEGLRQALVQVTKRGGSVVVVPVSKAPDRESYHQLFRALGVGGEQWTSATAAPALQEVALPDRSTPFFKDVFGAQPRQVSMPQAAPVLNWGRNGVDILRLRDGDSYLTEFESGKGKVFVFAAPFNRAYSDFVTHALFVPVLYRLATLSHESDQQVAYRLTAPTVRLAIPRAENSSVQVNKEEAAIRLVKDSVLFVPAQRVQGAEVRLTIPAEMNAPGFYEVQRQGKSIATLAFNADRHESELATYSVAELRELIGPHQPNVRVLDGEQPEAIARYRAEQTGQPLWRYCVLLALACLFAEGILLRFGRPKPTVGQPIVAA